MIHNTLWLCAFFSLVLTDNFAFPEKLPAWNETWTDKLRRDLLTNYDKMARPFEHFNATWVIFGIVPIAWEINDMENTLEVYGSHVLVWYDDKLSWNSSEYGGIATTQVGVHEVWVPDIHLLNSVLPGIRFYGNQNYLLFSDGRVVRDVQAVFHIYCHLDFTFWPFETNICRLSFRSWTYDVTQVKLIIRGNWMFPKNGCYPISEWILKNVTTNRRKEIFYDNPEPYYVVDFDFELSRASKIYYHIIFIPVIPIVFVSLITFWLQPQSQTKLLINASIILIVVLYLIYFGYKVPPRYDSTPIIVKFYSACLYQATISMLISAFVINKKNLAYFMTIPRPIRIFLLGKLGRYLGLGHIIQEIESQKSSTEQETCENDQINISMSHFLVNADERHQKLSSSFNRSILDLEWILLATAVDRLVFLLFCFTFTAMAVTYIRITISREQALYWII